MGEPPDWYRTICAARAMGGIEPWTLAEQPLIWQEWAILAEEAEAAARKEKKRKGERQAGSKRRGRGRH